MEYVLDRNIPIEKFFEEISRIPRESYHEELIADYVEEFAKTRNLKVYRDEIHNLIIKKPGSTGYENAKPVILQAHIDMVCAKTPDCVHDFRKDPIELINDNGIIRAKGTSLGADDGWGVSYMLAILDDDTLSHPPIEAVFTVAEEAGMDGAKVIDKSILESKRMICLDGDVDTETFVGSFSSSSLSFAKVFETSPTNDAALKVSIGDMSTNVYGGVNHVECGNSIKLIARLLKTISETVDFRIVEWNGGRASNIVPENSSVVISYRGIDAIELEKLIRAEYGYLNEEFEINNFHGRMAIEEASASEALSLEDSMNFVEFLYILPNNMTQSGIETKQLNSIINLGQLKWTNEGSNVKVALEGASRSRYKTSEAENVRRSKTIADIMGYEFDSVLRYSAWPYHSTSPIRAIANEAMLEEYGTELEATVCPGGLELSIFVNEIEGLDAIELGVNHDNPHSTAESMELESFHRMYKVVTTMLSKMN